MAITPQNLVRHELISLPVKVASATDPTQKNLRGRVIDESYGTLKIETENGEKVIAKKNTVFIFTLPNAVKVQVDGSLLVSRPEDRIKKKLPKW